MTHGWDTARCGCILVVHGAYMVASIRMHWQMEEKIGNVRKRHHAAACVRNTASYCSVTGTY